MSGNEMLESAEKAVIAALLMGGPLSEVRPHIRPDSFRDQACSVTFGAILTLAESGGSIDPISVAAELERKGTFQKVGGREFIADLLDWIPGYSNLPYHAKIVREAADSRRLQQRLESAMARLKKGDSTAREIGLELGPEMLAVSIEGDSRGFVELTQQLVNETLDHVQARREITRAGGVPGIATGYPPIDRMIDGFRPGEFIIIGGVPKSQKTSLCLNIAVNCAGRNDPVGIVSAEMNRGGVIERLLAANSRVPLRVLSRGDLTDIELSGLRSRSRNLTEGRIFIDDEAFPDLGDVLARATDLKSRHPAVKLIIVDYLQLVGHSMFGRRGDEELNAICRSLKGLAKRLQVPIIAPAQCNYKEIDSRSDKRPELRDLQGASGMAQTADFVGLIYNPTIYNPGAMPTLEVNFAASRRTAPFRVGLFFDPHSLRITEYASQREVA